MFEDFLQQLRLPEYVHVLLNPLPIYGVALGILALVSAVIIRSRPAQIPALIVLMVSGLSAWPVSEYGELAQDRVKTMVSEDGKAWLEEHEERAEKVIALFYILAAVAAVNIGVAWKAPRGATGMAAITILLACATLGAGTWIARAGGKIRHREFRTGPPPPHAHEHEGSKE